LMSDKKRGQATRDRIVAAARQLFAEQGFDGTTTAAIAERAGVAEGTIFRHFASKRELLLATTVVTVLAGIDDAFAQLDCLSPEEAVRAIVADRLRVVRANAPQLQILFREARGGMPEPTR